MRNQPFLYNNREFNTHLRFTDPASETNHRMMWVAVHTDSYSRTITFLTALSEHLKSIIPFKFELTGDPEVFTLGGDRYKNINSIQMPIKYDASLSADDVQTALENIGFYSGLERIL